MVRTTFVTVTALIRNKTSAGLGCLLFCGLLLYCGLAYAAPPPPDDFAFLVQGTNLFEKWVAGIVGQIMRDPDLNSIADVEWAVFAVVLLVFACVRFIIVGFSWEGFAEPLILIGMVRVLMEWFDELTSAFWDWSQGIGIGVQRIALGVGNTDQFFVGNFIYRNLTQFSFVPAGIIELFAGIMYALVISVIALLFLILTMLASSWALWGYALAKIIGFIFIPFIMFERLSFLFDGWLRFFFGFLVYNMVARVNLVLVAGAILSFLQLPSFNATTPAAHYSISNFTDVFGLLFMMLIGALSLFSTAQFASSIVSGATGVGSGIRGLAVTAAGAARLLK
jgi:hypothetical protein